MNTRQLYRTEALNAHQIKWLGEIILIRPISFSFLTVAASVLALLVLVFLFVGTYTKRSTITGQLMPDVGLVKVHAPQFGIVVKKNVTEGQIVNRGDVLYVLSSERYSDTLGSVQSSVTQQVTARRKSLLETKEKTLKLNQEEQLALEDRILGLKSELTKIDNQIEGQTSRVSLAEEAVTRVRGLVSQHFISKEQLQQREADMLDQRDHLRTLERDRISLGRELTAQKSNLASMPLRHQTQIAQIERDIASVGQELTESEAKRSFEITAPESGVATAITAEIGQTIDGGKPLLSIVPLRAKLQAFLYAPSRAIGFIKPGDHVLMRYQAYPYQKFGQMKGAVLFVAKVALPSSELASADMPTQATGGEPLYRITVSLPSQTINAYGRAQSLQAGMLLDADVLLERRRLYEWVLEPLYTLSDKL